MTQSQRVGYALIATPKQIAVMALHARYLNQSPQK